MGLFGFLRPAAPPAPAPPVPTQAAAPDLGDLAKTNALYKLVAVPKPDRDDAWDAAFLADLPAASFRCGSPQVVQGPDEFPYLQLLLPEPGVEFQCYVLGRMKDGFLLERGLGVVINPPAPGPGWVLTCGDVLHYHLTNAFYATGETPFSKQLSDEVIATEEEVLVGQPSELLLPAAARKVLREYRASHGVAAPQVALLVRRLGPGAGTVQDLVFNITPADFGSEEAYRSVMQRLAWFLPRPYSFVGMRQESPEDGFAPL